MTDTLAFLHSARPALAPETVAAILRETWGIEGRLKDLGGDRDQNLLVTQADGTRHLLKIGQAEEDPGVIDLQIAALRHVAARDPDLCVPGVLATLQGEWSHAVAAAGGGRHLLRVFDYLPGRPLLESDRTAGTMRAVGATLARLDRALQGFFHPHAGHALLWDVRQAPAIRAHALEIGDTGSRDRVLRILDHFTEHVRPRLDGLRAQVIHGDATAENVLVAGEPPAIGGLIDFGDTVHGSLAQELGVAMADTTWGMAHPWTAACDVAAGFDETIALEPAELEVLWDVAMTRLALTAAVFATREARRDEGLGSMDALGELCACQLDALEAVGRSRALAELRRTLRAPEAVAVPAGTPAAGAEALPAAPALLDRRRQHLMPGLELFYPEAPLHVVRGEGMWLIDAAGRRHLDCYNNVPHVGHCHPHVVNAVARQSATLNTNTRYLYASVVEYAERLAERLPGELGVAVFVNSGSEANDLAWRIARAATGHRGALVTAGAYHGCTEATALLSPQHAAPRSPDVRTFPVPGDEASAPDGADVDRALAALGAEAGGVAACLVDATFASDGIVDPPAGWLRSVFDRVRAAGGLCIADEVQAGFGRLGSWWGFEQYGVTPDIVTLGKPAANGYPLGAVVTTPEIMSAFTRRADFFSTFGGNPVACTAGLAVIDVVEREDLRARAADVGQHLRAGLSALAEAHPRIGAVRGRGLFIGVELVGGDGAREPATAATARVALALRRAGVLVGIEGRYANVLKIRPPLICEREHADRLTAALAHALESA